MSICSAYSRLPGVQLRTFRRNDVKSVTERRNYACSNARFPVGQLCSLACEVSNESSELGNLSR